jgi:type I restriction enzyme S subunit
MTSHFFFLPLYLLQCLKAQKRGVLVMISEAGHGTKKFDQNSMERSNVPTPPLPLQQKFAALQHRAFRGEL